MAPVVSRPSQFASRIAVAALALWLAPLPGLSQTPPAATTPAPSASPATPPAAAPASPAAASPPAATPTTPTPPATQAPATQAPAASSPAPQPSAPAAQAPSGQPPAAQATPPATPPSTQTADPFGEELTLTARTVVLMKGSADWDSAFETITDSLKKLGAYLDKQNIKAVRPTADRLHLNRRQWLHLPGRVSGR